MNATDLLVLDYLTTRAGFAAHQIEHLCEWWRAAAGDGEALTTFLVRQELLSESTVQIFVQIAGGHLTANMGYTLLDAAELEGVRVRLPEVAVLGKGGESDATMTLLAGETD